MGHSNWQYVSNHVMHIYVAGVKKYGNPDDQTFYDGPEVFDIPPHLRPYAFIKDTRNSPDDLNSSTCDRVTNQNGETIPQVYVKAGKKINDAYVIWIDCDDNDQWRS